MARRGEPESEMQEADQSERLTSLKINRKFARRFEDQKRKEDLHRAKAYGLLDDEDSDDGEAEDEDGAALTAKLDFDIMKTISMIRNKDERIYEGEFKPFDGAEGAEDDEDEGKSEGEGEGEGDAAKPMRYKDLVRQQVLARVDGADDGDNADLDEDEDEDDGAAGDKHAAVPGSYVATQSDLKRAFKSAAAGADSDEEVLALKKKSANEVQHEEDSFKQYMSTMQEQNRRLGRSAKKEDVDMLEKLFAEPVKDQDEDFLRDFVLKRGWVDPNESARVANRSGTAGMLGDSDDDEDDDDDDEGEGDKKGGAGDDDDDEDLAAVEKADEYEARYNFRFEEPGAEQLTSHARKTESSVRRKDPARKRQRLTKRERKREEKARREEELRRLKNLKRGELDKKLAESARLAGLKEGDALAFDAEDLDKDFDPAEWDAKMAKMFNEEYYNDDGDADFVASGRVDEADYGADFGADEVGESVNIVERGAAGDDEADEADEAEEGGRRLRKERKERKKRGGILVDGVANGQDSGSDQDSDSGGEGRGEGEGEGEKPSVAARIAKAQRDFVNEELYKLDYEDVIAGGIKTRFKYRKVEANSFGLSAAEIFAAPDSLLNGFVSIKHMAPYQEEEWKSFPKQRRRFRRALRETLDRSGKKKKKKKKEEEAKKEDGDDAADDMDEDGGEQDKAGSGEEGEEGKDTDVEKKKKKKKAAKTADKEAAAAEDEETSTKKKKRRKRKRASQAPAEAEVVAEAEAEANTGANAETTDAAEDEDADADAQGASTSAKKKKKRKRKKKSTPAASSAE